jgi:hypothetical protein
VSLQVSPPEIDPTGASAASPTSSTWVRYYDRASRKRHQLGGYRRLRDLAKRRRRAQTIYVVAAGLAVAVLFWICSAILSR